LIIDRNALLPIPLPEQIDKYNTVYGLPSSLFFLLMDADNPIPEDIARSKLKIDTRRFLIGVNNKERFADVPVRHIGSSGVLKQTTSLISSVFFIL
jgi:hypothetical protein